MLNLKKSAKAFKKIPWLAVGIVCLFLIFALLIVSNHVNNQQALRPTGVKISFAGEYSVDGGPWHKIEEGKHIPATEGDVTLRGYFHMYAPSGEYLAPAKKGMTVSFFLDHVNVKVYESGQRPYELYNENPLIGPSACGEIWMPYSLLGEDRKSVV